MALALQQLERCLNLHEMIYATGIQITPGSAVISKCKSDLVVISKDHDGHVHITIGECETRKEILDDDIDNLMKVADAFPFSRVKVYLLFAKTAQFTDSPPPGGIEASEVRIAVLGSSRTGSRG